MKTALYCILLCAVFFNLSHALYTPNDKVVLLKASEFEQKVLKSDEVWIVEFFAPWCGHCKRLAPEYAKAAKSLNGVVNIAAIDCDQEKEIAGRYGVKGFPTIKVFPAGKENKKGAKVEDYQGPRTAKGITDYALSKLPNGNVKAVSANSFEAFLKDPSDALPRVLLMTTKKATPPLVKSLALSFKGRALFGEMRETEGSLSAVATKFGVSKMPAILLFPVVGDQVAEEPIQYEGEVSKADLTAFIGKHVKQQSAASGTSEKKGSKKEAEAPKKEQPKPAAPTAAPIVADLLELTPENQDKLCGQKADKICVLSFVKILVVPSPGVHVENRKELVSPAELSVLEELTERYRRDKFRIVWVDALRYPAFAKAFGVDALAVPETLPALVAYRPKGPRYATHNFRPVGSEESNLAEFTVSSASLFVDRIAGGEVHFSKLDAAPQMSAAAPKHFPDEL